MLETFYDIFICRPLKLCRSFCRSLFRIDIGHIQMEILR